MLSWVFRALQRMQTPMCPGSLKVLPHRSVPQYLCVQEAVLVTLGLYRAPPEPVMQLGLGHRTGWPVCYKAATISLHRLSYIFLKVEVEGQPMWPTLYHLRADTSSLDTYSGSCSVAPGPEERTYFAFLCVLRLTAFQRT